MEEDWICVQTYLNRNEAELARLCLEREGIECLVTDDDTGGESRPGLAYGTSARVLVREADRDAAVRILENIG